MKCTKQANFDLLEARERQARIRKAVMLAEEEQRRRIKEDTRRRTLVLQEEFENRVLAQSTSITAMVYAPLHSRSLSLSVLLLCSFFLCCVARPMSAAIVEKRISHRTSSFTYFDHFH
jgi:hypothetical protein